MFAVSQALINVLSEYFKVNSIIVNLLPPQLLFGKSTLNILASYALQKGTL